MAEKVTPADIKTIRENRRWSIARLAREIGCASSTAWRMESGEMPISGMADRLLAQLRDNPAQSDDEAARELARIQEAARWIATDPVGGRQRAELEPIIVEKFGLNAIQAKHAVAEGKLMLVRAI